MADILEIMELGNPVLRHKAREIQDIYDHVLQTLIDSMILTVKDVSGVGLAAPQVGKSIRLFIMSSYPNKRYPDAPEMIPTAVINPEIIDFSSEIVKGWEGCLSIPGIRAPVPRHKFIDVRYTDRYGKIIEERLDDFVARIFQHEHDHLEGKVFLDRLEDNSEIITEREYFNLP